MNSDEDTSRAAAPSESGAKASHALGLGAGALGAGAAGATVGAIVAGPAGAVLGGVAAAVAGGLGGRAIAQAFNPTAEERYWREHFRSRPYATPQTRYEDLEPAFRYGWETRAAHPREPWEQLEQHLEEGWRCRRCEQSWEEARDPVRDAFERARFHDPEHPQR